VTSRTAAIVAGVALVVAMAAAVWMMRASSGAGSAPGAGPAVATPGGASPPEDTGPTQTIKARLFYVSEDGTGLTSVERDVPFGEGVDQAQQIVRAQIAAPAAPLVSAVPPGTELRALFITDRGEAYVDLSREASFAHAGGTLAELLTVYTIVNALTVNLPAVNSVQLLIEGREVPTLAGHVDVRQPLAENLALVQ
jgi:spore germination protein GerM